MYIPSITPEHIVNYCGKRIYERGKEFLDAQAFYVFYKEWSTLKALCQGTAMSSYSVKITFDSLGIINSCCTCYSNKFGPCKHIAALLLMLYENPQAFLERKEWFAKLKIAKPQEIIELLEKIVDLYPDISNTCDSPLGHS